MLPKDLRGPETGIYFSDTDEVAKFIADAERRYPDLHRNFITQICFELPSHFNLYLPRFDVKVNKVVVRQVSAQWIKESVRYDDNKSLENSFYGFHVENASRLPKPLQPPLLREMLTNKTWPFLPVIVEHDHGVKDLGSKQTLGHPYHLIEGCHRVSYLLKMLELGCIAPDSKHDVLEVV